MRCATLDPIGHFNRHNQISAIKHVVTVRCVARQAMKFSERNRPLAVAPANHDFGVQGRKCYGHVRRMCSDAFVRPSKDRVKPIETIPGGAAGTRFPFVARKVIFVAEVGTTRALHDVTAHRRHVSKLAGCGEQQAFGDHRESTANLFISGHITHSS